MKLSSNSRLSSLKEHHKSFKGSLVLRSAASVSASSSKSDQDDDDQSPPISPLRLPQLSASSSSISSWCSSSSSSASQSSDCLTGEQCNSKEVRAAYNTKFARYHLETYRQNDRLRWNFDFDHNRPLDDSHHHHHQTVPRYQWEPTL